MDRCIYTKKLNIHINIIDVVGNVINLKTISNIQIPTHCTTTIPTKLTGKCIATIPCILEVKIDKILAMQNPQLVMLPTVYLNMKEGLLRYCWLLKSDTNLPCTPTSAKCVCSSAEVNTYRKNNVAHTPHSLETVQTLNKLCEEYKDIFLLHQGDIGHTKLLAMDIDTGDHPPTTQKPFTLPLKHTQLVCGEL